MQWSHVAIIVTSLEQAQAGLRSGATDIVFAVSLNSELIPDPNEVPLPDWGRRIKALGGRPHIQFRDQALSPDLISEYKKLICLLADAGFVECWTSDLGLLSEFGNDCAGITPRADWRLPLTNADACQVALAAGAKGLCLAPPFPECPADANTAYLLIQGAQTLDPRMNYQPELFAAPFLLNDLEWQIFTYSVTLRDFTSAENHKIRSLEGMWHSSICPFAHLEAQNMEWRGWGCAVCEAINARDGWVVVELLGSTHALTTAMQMLRIASVSRSAEVFRSTLAKDPELRPYLCKRGARCRLVPDNF